MGVELNGSRRVRVVALDDMGVPPARHRLVVNMRPVVTRAHGWLGFMPGWVRRGIDLGRAGRGHVAALCAWNGGVRGGADALHNQHPRDANVPTQSMPRAPRPAAVAGMVAGRASGGFPQYGKPSQKAIHVPAVVSHENDD